MGEEMVSPNFLSFVVWEVPFWILMHGESGKWVRWKDGWGRIAEVEIASVSPVQIVIPTPFVIANNYCMQLGAWSSVARLICA